MFYRLCSLIVCLVLTLLFLCGCMAFSDPNPFPADPWDLMISESAIPAGWQLLQTRDRPIASFGEEAAALLIFYYPDDPQRLTRGGITVYRHQTLQRAAQHYKIQAEAHFSPDQGDHYTEFIIPEGFVFSSATADEWEFGCSVHGVSGLFADTLHCEYLGRYGGNVVYFSIALEYRGQETIDPIALQDLVEDIDEGMSPELGP